MQKNQGVVIERIRVTPKMIEEAFKRIRRTKPITERVLWRYWEAGFERNHHGASNVVDLGDLDSKA